jgi:hypothetical protein
VTIATKINEYLTNLKPKAVCDDCIRASLKLSQRQQAALRTETLATTSDFQRQRDECFLCHSEKLVIRRI